MLQRKGGIVNSIVINEDEHLKCIDLENTEWTWSLFHRMGFERRATTTGRRKIPDGAIKEAGFLFHHSIIDIVDRYQIPPSLIMNVDQTLLKYAPVISQTLDKKKIKTVAISGLLYQKAVVVAFDITFSNSFLPM